MPSRSPLFEGAGALRPAYERVDWSATPLGEPSTWPVALRSALSMGFSTRFPVLLCWGPDLIMVYNEAYVALIADKHPGALGRPAAEVFPEAWDVLQPWFATVQSGEGIIWTEDQRLLMERKGFLEECFFTFSYSPVIGDDGGIAGVLDIATETTRQVVDRRRLALLALLGDRLRGAVRAVEVPELALPVLRSASLDFAGVDLVQAGEPGIPARLGERAALVEETADGIVAWLRLADSGWVLRIVLSKHLAPDEPHLEFLVLVATSLSGAFTAAAARELDRRASDAARSMSEALQRSLLTDPPQPDHLQIAVRYLPATQDAQVGGDWYDAFLNSNGATCVVVGDVSGHDQQAAAAMGQVRNLMRGIAYTISEPPGAVLTALDLAMRDLAVGALATAVLAVVEQTPEEADAGLRRLRWSNAGHLPPLLVHADGTTELLRTEPDLLLGLDPGTARHDHEYVVQPGTTVLLYTDGLVERRGATIDDGLVWLLETTASMRGRSADGMCDALLALVAGHTDDDVALLALRAHSESVPRPREAGPGLLPHEMNDRRQDSR